MKLREIRFNDLERKGYKSLSIYKLANEADTAGNEVAFGLFSDVLFREEVLALIDNEVIKANEFFGTLVLRVKGDY